MKIQDIYNKAIALGIDADFRTKDRIENLLKRKQEKFAKLSGYQKEEFDQESLKNPYSDTRVLHVAEDKEIKRALVGIDIDTAEIILAKMLGNIDIVISHHPLGRALADMHEVMELQVDVLNQYGVPVNIGEGLLKEKISEISRGFNPRNNTRAIDAAKLLGINLMCLHTVADNSAAKFLRGRIEGKDIELVSDLMDILRTIEEYQEATKLGVGPRLFVGSPENRAGKVALSDITGGTDGSPKLMEKLANAGIGTIISMHTSEEHKKEAELAHLNVVVAGHMSSDSIGMNVILDELQRDGVEIVPCSGMIRISRA